MSKFKIFAVSMLAMVVVDNLAWGGFYRREVGRDVRDTANHVSSLNWHGLNPDG